MVHELNVRVVPVGSNSELKPHTGIILVHYTNASYRSLDYYKGNYFSSNSIPQTPKITFPLQTHTPLTINTTLTYFLV